jgi:hypothetical protein
MRAAVVALLFLGACKPDFGTPLSLLDHPRVLAVRGTPAEVAPGAKVLLEPLVAGPDGAIDPPSLDWSVCNAQKPLTSNDVVADACLTINGVSYLGYALPSVTTPVPLDACKLFGPEMPPQMPDMADGRPAQPDATGGYYQPYRVDLGNDFTVALERVRCGLRGASMDVALDFAMRYQPNVNPTLGDITATLDGAPLPLDQVPAGRRIRLTASWPADAAEVYPILDLNTQQLVDHREALRVSWYAGAGQLTDERTGRDGDDPTLDTSNDWTAPTTPGPVHAWAVLRDDRGGVAWTSFELDVVP